MNIATTATTIFANFYQTSTDTPENLNAYLQGWLSSENGNRELWAIVDMLDRDLRDMMHNGNAEDLLGPDVTEEQEAELLALLNTPDNDDANDFYLILASLIITNAHTSYWD